LALVFMQFGFLPPKTGELCKLPISFYLERT
jgi:hypothetical protein